jgi:alpha-1,6-mannosyltransferase
LFTLLSLPLAKVGLATAIWLIKAFTAAASLGCVALVWACAKRLGRDPLPAALFVGLNPLLLIFAVGGGHNDLLMMLAALGGIYFLLDDRVAGVTGIVAAAAIKLSAAVILPFAILGSKDRVRALIWTLATGAAGITVSVLIFGVHVASVRRVLGNIARHATPINIPGFVLNDILRLGVSVHLQDHIGVAILIPVLIVLLVRTWRGGDWLAATGWATFAMLVTTTWLLPWYMVWWLPFAALVEGREQRLAALGFTVLIVALEVPLIL